MSNPKRETSIEITPPLASYAPIEVEGSGVPYIGNGRMGDTRGAGREGTQGCKHGFTRKDMAKSFSQYSDGSRKRKS
jgi:hypothetical protein